MAKALLGYVGGADPRLATEVQRLRKRITDLEAQVTRLQAENDNLAQAADEHNLLDETSVAEPALT